MMKKIKEILIASLGMVFILWLLYIALIYRFQHPELTETQLSLKVFSAGFYNPLEEK